MNKTVITSIIIVVAVIVIVVALVVNNTGRVEDDGIVVPFDPNTEYELTFGVYGDLERAYEAVVESDSFKAALPNVSIEFMTADFNGHHTRLQTVIAAKEQTNDIESLEVAYIAQFVENKGLRNVSAEFPEATEITDALVPFAVSSGQTIEGDQYAVPVDVAPAVLFYRESLVRASGVDPIEIENIRDWDHYIEIGQQLTRDTDGDGEIDQYALPHANEAALIPLNGGKSGWFNADGNPLEPKEKYIASLELVKSIRDAGIDADLGAWSGPWIESYKNGTVVTTVTGAWFGGALRTWIAPEVDDWRVAYLPGRVPSSAGGTYLAITNTVPSDRVAAAWEVIKYFVSSEESQISVFSDIYAFPSLVSVYDDPIMEESEEYFGGQQARLIFADVAQDIPSSVFHQYDSVASTVWGSATSAVINDDANIDDAYALAVEQIIALTQ